ncbi:MAG: polyprenol phosphomannose-dependent alpha 1,6 mannosyltransferase MptB [Actinomycetota bacterium]|nr:polyprenol phosphomannose-dependent alpha 1,6 mannosyltransferase MptB [Actinomycetota bacterium]
MSVAAQSEIAPARTRSGQWAPALVALCALVLLAATGEIVLDGALAHSPFVPKQPAIAGWMAGIGEHLGQRVFLIALLAFAGAYLALLALASYSEIGGISKRGAILLIGALHAIIFLGPILLSTDVFSYIAYARMGVEHGLNPYLHGPIAIIRDPVYRYVGQDWKHVATAYGPLYTLLSYPLAPLGVKGALWGMKLEALLASAGTLVLVWRCARARGLNPVTAVLAVGANPLYVLYGLGGAHNDLIMLLMMMAAVSFSFAGREASATALVIAGALVKVTVAALLPFMILARRSRAQILGVVIALAFGALIGYLAFGVHGIDLVAALNRDAAFVSTDSFPTEIAHLFGKPGVFPIDHDLLKGGLVVIVVYLLWRTWRGYDWIAASGWTLLAISVTSTWLLAWYILWPLPLAVIARDRRLLVATLAVQALFIAHQTASLFVPVA